MEPQLYFSTALFILSCIYVSALTIVVIRMGVAMRDRRSRGRPVVWVGQQLRKLPFVVGVLLVLAHALVVFWYLPAAFAVASTYLVAAILYMAGSLPKP